MTTVTKNGNEREVNPRALKAWEDMGWERVDDENDDEGEAEDDSDDEAEDDDDVVVRPADRAPKAQWIEYIEDLGGDASDSMTVAELRGIADELEDAG